MKFCTHVYGPQSMNPVDSGDPLTFPPTPPAGQMFSLASKTKDIPISIVCTLFSANPRPELL